MLIGLSGYAQSGKDTVGQTLVDDYGFTRVSFADKLRELALAAAGHLMVEAGHDEWVFIDEYVSAFGWEMAKQIPEIRTLLQNLGTGVRDIIDPDAWVKAANLSQHDNVVVTDMRFPNEYDAVMTWGTAIRITRPGYGPVNGHISETAIDGCWFPVHINNDGSLEDLKGAVKTAVRLVTP